MWNVRARVFFYAKLKNSVSHGNQTICIFIHEISVILDEDVKQ